MFSILKTQQKSIEPDSFLKLCFSFKFTKKLVAKYEKEYTEKPDKEILD